MIITHIQHLMYLIYQANSSSYSGKKKQKGQEKTNVDSESEDSLYVDETIQDDSDGNSDRQLVRIYSMPIEIDDRTSDAIVIPCCKIHERYANFRCCINLMGNPRNEPICDIYLYARE